MDDSSHLLLGLITLHTPVQVACEAAEWRVGKLEALNCMSRHLAERSGTWQSPLAFERQ